jgi:hypothetical protein
MLSYSRLTDIHTRRVENQQNSVRRTEECLVYKGDHTEGVFKFIERSFIVILYLFP